jgi:D-aminoacyl-tRNA deacylase
MRILLQRVSEAKVSVSGDVVGLIKRGVVLLVGISPNDGESQAKYLAEKIANLRIFPDENEKNNLSLLDIKGEALVISQFTLFADTRKGRRPAYIGAAPPKLAEPLVKKFADILHNLGVPTATGVFGAHMDVTLTNNGPITIWLERD